MLLMVRCAEQTSVLVARLAGVGGVPCWMPNAREPGGSVAAEVVAVPLRLPVCVLPAALRGPPTDTLFPYTTLFRSVTVRVQVPLTARVEGLRGQLLVWLKSPVLAPVSEMLLMV